MTRFRLLTTARAVSLTATTLVLGMLFAHVLEQAPKRRLDYPTYVAVQLHLYGSWGLVAAILEPVALIATVVVLVMLRRRRGVAVLTGVAALCQAAALAVFFAVVDPVNRTQAGWTAGSQPANWQHIRDRWEYGHTAAAALYAVAFAVLLAAVLADTRRHSSA